MKAMLKALLSKVKGIGYKVLQNEVHRSVIPSLTVLLIVFFYSQIIVAFHNFTAEPHTQHTLGKYCREFV